VPDNRELATAILLFGFLVFALSVQKARAQIPGIIRAAANVAWLFGLYVVAAALVIWGASFAGLWTPDLWWSTSIVVMGLGVGLVASAAKCRSVRQLWDAVAGKTVGVAVLLGLYVNLATFPLIVEILLQALAALAAMVRVAAEYQGQAPARRLADGVLALIGVGFVARTSVVLAQGMPGSEWLDLLRQVLLGVWFPVSLVPLLYAVAYFSAVEQAAIGVRVIAPRRTGKWPLVGRLLLAFHSRLALAAAFDRAWGRRYADAKGARERHALLARFRKTQRPKFVIPRPSAIARARRRIGGKGAPGWDGRSMPRTPEHLAEVLAAKPPGWEWLAFGASLWIGLALSEDDYRRHQRRRPASPEGPLVDSQQAIPHLSLALAEGGSLPEAINDILGEARQERAFGLPGFPGDEGEIAAMVEDLVSVYLGFMAWASKVRATQVPAQYRGAYRAAARLMDGPIEQVRHFAASLAEQLDMVPDHLASPSGRPLCITLTLALSIRPEDQARFDRALRRLGHRGTGALTEPHVKV